MKKPIAILLLTIFIHSFVICNWSFVIADEYRLAPSDQLEIRIIGQKDLDTKQTIAPDGSISLPLLGRVTAQGQTLTAFNKNLTTDYSKYIRNPQVVVYLTPRPIYVIQHDVRKNTWDVKEAKSIAEANAYMGVSSPNSQLQTPNLHHGATVSVEVGQKPDWWEDNWYKVLTGAAVLVGGYATLHR